MNQLSLINEIIALEYAQFDKVHNEGGRAGCQDDFTTFEIMRKSQFLVWTIPLLTSYRQDLLDAEAHGWNLVMEKYARMEESTCPSHYEKIKNQLPPLSPERITLQEKLLTVAVDWKIAFAKDFPKLNGNGRLIHSYEDTLYDTSYETYLRGEISTYSENTLSLLAELFASFQENDQNMVSMIMEHTVQLYRYPDLSTAEAAIEF